MFTHQENKTIFKWVISEEEDVIEIGRDFGNRYHTTVMHACKNIDKLLKDDQVLRADYDNLLRILNH